MSRYVDIEPLENALKAVEKRGEVAVLLDELISVIAKYPIADVQEVRHGRWIDPEDLTCYKCSVCGEYATQEYGLTEPIFWDYCPNCGARMDEVTE